MMLWGISVIIFRNITVKTVVHGHSVYLNYGYTYPIYSRLYRTLNDPLVELVYQCYLSKNSPINVIDVGAAIGDTALLMLTSCPEMIGELWCIDGEEFFFKYLQANLKNYPDVHYVFTRLSDKDGRFPALVRQHEGTASARGGRDDTFNTLDSTVSAEHIFGTDLLKIDVDGFDGKVLGGSARLLKTFNPAVIFEWYPDLYQKTGNDILYPFKFLAENGYENFIWYDKFGTYHCVMHGFDQSEIEKKKAFCAKNNKDIGWHYDVIALHRTSRVSVSALIEMKFAKARNPDI